MKATIGVYNSHHEAVEAVKELKNGGYPAKQLSIVGKAHAGEDEELVVKNTNMGTVAGTEVGLGALLGTAVGVLTGVGIFAIPGLGFLYGAGALVGAIAGLDFGLIGGGIASALTVGGLTGTDAASYEEDLKAGKFLVIAHGSQEELARAKDILNAHGKHTRLSDHH